MDWRDVIDFWFHECGVAAWFGKTTQLDTKVRAAFHDVYWQIVAGEMEDWRCEPLGRLAEILVLDQFARNMFRATPQAFAQDALALALAQEAVRAGVDGRLSVLQRQFLYMPYMHSESRLVHARAVVLFANSGTKAMLKHEEEHRSVIDRFGRFPHRNAILGRVSSTAELEYLQAHPGF
jgi:uncharacterized protein (DUF924 family)